MKYTVNVGDKSYEVEIDDLNARPVVARIDGQEFKVTPEEKRRAAALPTEKSEFKPGALSTGISSTELTAPLPGTVIEIFVKPGEYVEMGQVMLIIEAMKMKNSIRSTCAGTIAEVLVSAGQTVAHKQVLLKFADAFLYR